MTKYIIGAVVLLAVLYYFFGLDGAALGLLGLGTAKTAQLTREAAKLEAEAKKVNEDLEKIKKEKEALDRDGVKEMTPEEEKEYWKNQ